MKYLPCLLTAAVTGAALLFGQALVPTAKAQPVSPAEYHLRLDWQKAERGVSGLVIQGRVTNTGSQPLVYTQVTPMLSNRTGKEIFRGSGYLTVSPLLPGQSAEFRACEPAAPPYAALRLVFREAGHAVVVETPRVPDEKPARLPAKIAQAMK